MWVSAGSRMVGRSGSRYVWVTLVLIASLNARLHPGRADDTHPADLLLSAEEEASHFLSPASAHRRLTFLSAAMLAPTVLSGPAQNLQLDLSPVLANVANLLRDYGMPTEEQLDPSGSGPIAVSTSFKIRDDLPAMSVQIGDRSFEPLGAFYAGNEGVRWAVVWPVKRLTLRVEGGEDSEFGNFAIAGAQWRHPKRPFAVGFGVPMNLRNAAGDIGLILQFRMKIY